MVLLVVVVNILIAGFCFVVAWHVRKLRRLLVEVRHALDTTEHSTHQVLHGAPEAIRRGEIGIYQLRQKYRQLEPQLRGAQQALTLLSFGQIVWQQRRRVSRKRSTQSVHQTHHLH
ncbi:MAG: hypothetical protein ACFE0J_01400 [Elainellaceae cyanobacterium]